MRVQPAESLLVFAPAVPPAPAQGQIEQALELEQPAAPCGIQKTQLEERSSRLVQESRQ